MAWEQSKSAKRRFNIGSFQNRYFVGNGIDVGGKPDPLSQYIGIFSKMISVKIWDIEDGDAQYLSGIPDNHFDFLHSSHCLEHMVDVHEAMNNWIRVIKPNGFLIVTVPDEDLYEQGMWPSRFNSDHKWTFTIYKDRSWSPRSINIVDLVKAFSQKVIAEKIELQRDFYNEILRSMQYDQSLTVTTECSIEFILQKKV
jgi:predicted SAM-dependent methyltransferase